MKPTREDIELATKGTVYGGAAILEKVAAAMEGVETTAFAPAREDLRRLTYIGFQGDWGADPVAVVWTDHP
jgi:hypothetical protein